MLLHAGSFLNAQIVDQQALWSNVVTLDRTVWLEREGKKDINDLVNDEDFVRRIYLDITGKIPTYDQMLAFIKSKDINKRQELIETLLNSPGYVGHFSVFWQDLLRDTNLSREGAFKYKEYTRYVERFLAENKPYDKIVYDLLTAEGSVHDSPAMGYYYRDEATGVADTFNATTRAFLGTRLGCAQCHNHRFDKWTQKEFYEASAFMHGVKYKRGIGPIEDRLLYRHVDFMKKDKRFEGEISNYARTLLSPSVAEVEFTYNKPLTFPENYAYDNAKPDEVVKEKIVFDYGDKNLTGKTKREQFAHWLTSKNNPVFARVMTNRLWKRIMGVANMEPVDDYKDSVIIQNEALYVTLGKIFVELDYDLKAFLSVIFNSEAYQYAFDTRNELKQDNYKAQGAVLKRMSFNQLSDSLLVLRYGNLDPYSKLDPQYFEFEDKLANLTLEYKKTIFPMIKAFQRQYGSEPKDGEFSTEIVDVMLAYHKKVKELEDYYQIDKNGFLKTSGNPTVALAKTNKNDKGADMMGMMEQEGSMKQDGNKTVMRANYISSDFVDVFGKSDRSVTTTNLETTATMKQLLKLANSEECRSVAKEDSFLMKNTLSKEKIPERVQYLYYSIYGRAPTNNDVKLAAEFCNGTDKNDNKLWSKYVLALLNSPEFYFIK